jgi:hypothetical protein
MGVARVLSEQSGGSGKGEHLKSDAMSVVDRGGATQYSHVAVRLPLRAVIRLTNNPCN